MHNQELIQALRITRNPKDNTCYINEWDEEKERILIEELKKGRDIEDITSEIFQKRVEENMESDISAEIIQTDPIGETTLEATIPNVSSDYSQESEKKIQRELIAFKKELVTLLFNSLRSWAVKDLPSIVEKEVERQLREKK